jgi:hypothetical protein
MKKEIKAWAIKLRKRNFYQNIDGHPFLYSTKSNASTVAMRIRHWEEINAEPVRVRVRIEEIV